MNPATSDLPLGHPNPPPTFYSIVHAGNEGRAVERAVYPGAAVEARAPVPQPGPLRAEAEPPGLFLNTRVPPFDRLDARRAINLAVDRAAATSAWGGRNVAEPTCQLLPPNVPSYRPYCPYTAGSTTSGTWTAPDLAKAKALVARSGTRGMKVTVWAWSEAKGFNQVAVKVLSSLGYRVVVKPVVGDRYWGVVSDSRNRAQIGFDGWDLGYQDPGAWLQHFSCAAFLPGDPDNLNGPEFCDPGIDRLMRRAQAEQLSDPIGSRTLATGRPRAHRRCTVGAAHSDEGRELRLEARRQLPVQPGDGHADRPALGTVGQQGRDGVAAGRTLCRVDSTRSGRSVRWDTLGRDDVLILCGSWDVRATGGQASGGDHPGSDAADY